MIDITNLPVKLQWIYLFSGVLLFLGSLLIVQVLIVLFSVIRKAWNKVIVWNRKPNPKNLHLYSGSVYGDVFTLKFRCAEWRYPFSKIQVFAYAPVLYLQSETNNISLEFKGWRDVDQRKMSMWKTYEVDLIQFDSEKKIFWFKAGSTEKKRFQGPGIFRGEIDIAIIILGTKYEAEPTIRKFFIKATYLGENKISAEVKNQIPVEIIE